MLSRHSLVVGSGCKKWWWGCASGLKNEANETPGYKTSKSEKELTALPSPIFFGLITMSGVEVAGLVFGVLPILVEVIKSYSTVANGLHTFRHWSREVRSVALQVKVQNGIFLNECRLLLRLVEDKRAAHEMLNDTGNQRWNVEDLDRKLSAVLKDNYDVYLDIINETKHMIDEIKQDLKKFDILNTQQRERENLKTTIKRLRGAISIAFDKSRYEKCIASLRDRNGDLGAVRSQIGSFKLLPATTNSLVTSRKELPSRYASIQQASDDLHKALCTSWCCPESTRHSAKLCLEAEAGAEVSLNLAMCCQDEVQTPDLKELPTWFYVQSMSMNHKAGTMSPPQAFICDQNTASSKTLTPTVKRLPKIEESEAFISDNTTRKRRKYIHERCSSSLAMDFTLPPIFPQTSIAVQSTSTSLELNLCHSNNICHYLKNNRHKYEATFEKSYVGYLETPSQCKYNFFKKKYLSQPESTAYSLFDIMKEDPDDFLAVEDQLKVAHRAATCILQYNNTPWLADRWRLNNISYFGARNVIDQEAIKTLHVSSQLSPSAKTCIASADMDGIQHSEDKISDEIRYGINNLPLFFLGVALIEIAHWSPIENKMVAKDANDQVYAARRLASGRAPLGPEYQKIAQKCLQCNFGVGTNLSNKGLQAAIYNDVICELEGMISRLSV